MRWLAQPALDTTARKNRSVHVFSVDCYARSSGRRVAAFKTLTRFGEHRL
ncbi:hypothetical protein KCP70_23415 [Salmonella enterica subsp. enterica]|nr:hypothetical protein KCP70_23415 [Salmonella enterica subsp. enterica]